MSSFAMRRVVLVTTLAALCACDERKPAPTAPTAQASAVAAAAPDALCEHGVLAAACAKCNPQLEAIYRAKGNWCEEHGFAESFCPICHPELGGRPPGSGAKPAAAVAEAPADGTKVTLRSKAILDGMGLATVKATPATEGAKLTLPARLTYDATKTAEINARSPGVVRKLLVDLGATVKRGDALATVESADVGADRARLGAAQKRVTMADERLERLRGLERDGAVSRKERLEAERELGDARAEAGALASELTMLGAGAGAGSTYTLTSPIDGVVARRTASIGTLVGPENVIFQVVDARTLWAEIDVPEGEIGKVGVGAEVVVSFTALPADTFAARIASVAPEVDPHTRTAVARASLDNPSGKLRANMFGEAALLGPAPAHAVTIPADAVQTVGATRLLFVRTGELSFEVRHVGLPQRRGALSIVKDGLKSGEEVVTTGAFLLKTETLKDSIGAGCCAVD